jgi:hypothetical protein
MNAQVEEWATEKLACLHVTFADQPDKLMFIWLRPRLKGRAKLQSWRQTIHPLLELNL